MDRVKVVVGALRDDAVDKDKALPRLHVQVPHGRELLRPRSVEDLKNVLLIVNLHLLPVRIFDCRVVFHKEDALDKPHRDRRLPNGTTPKHDDFVIFDGHVHTVLPVRPFRARRQKNPVFLSRHLHPPLAQTPYLYVVPTDNRFETTRT